MAMPARATQSKSSPLWTGPGGTGRNGGLTFSLLTKFLDCRWKFRVRVYEGLKTSDKFLHRLEFGNMWHACKEGGKDWRQYLQRVIDQLSLDYPMERGTITHWQEVVLKLYPEYLKYTATMGMSPRKSLCREQVFDILYRLPSGRIVRLRGKFDEVSLEDHVLGMDEHKTKGEVDVDAVERQLLRDLQTMMYWVALEQNTGIESIEKAKKQLGSSYGRSISYNVIRRPLSGGKGTIVRHKATKNKAEETLSDYYNRLAVYFQESPQDYFHSWEVGVTPMDIKRFQVETFDPILEQVCMWWDVISTGVTNNPIHWRKPRGVYGEDDSWDAVDQYLETGSTIGLRKVTNLFPELQPD